ARTSISDQLKVFKRTLALHDEGETMRKGKAYALPSAFPRSISVKRPRVDESRAQVAVANRC
ncbi:MAG: hypothetical protein AAGA56_27240, partial [Myxococcota bacterium]